MKTARESLLCKRSTAASIASEVTSSSPLLHRIYFYRRLCIQKLILACIDPLPSSQTVKMNQLLVLGAGLDDYSAYSSLFSAVICVDLPAVITSRRDLYPLSQDILIAADLNDSSSLFRQLALVSSFSFSAPTVILTEFVLGYVRTSAVESLLSVLARQFTHAVLISYDLCLPAPSDSPHPVNYYQKMLSSFANRKAPLLTCLPSKEAQSSLFFEKGWPHVWTCTVQDFLLLFTNPEERAYTNKGEPFDEYASLAVLHKQYVVTLASSNCVAFGSANLKLNTAVPFTKATYRLRVQLLENRVSLLERKRCVSCIGALSIRPAQLDDRDLIMGLIQISFADVIGRYKAVRKFINSSIKRDVLHVQEGYHAWVVLGGPSLIAYGGVQLSYGINKALLAEVKHVCCEPTFRRKGAARILLQTILDLCRKSHVERVSLSTLDEQHAAIALYEKFGFHEMQRTPQPEQYCLVNMILTTGIS